MDDKHKDILLTQRVKLVENINVRGGLYTQLLARKVLTRRQIQNIKAARTTSEQTEELLDELELSGSKAFDLFCEALKADHQQEIVDLYLKPLQENKESQEDVKCEGTEETKSSASGTMVPHSDSEIDIKSPSTSEVHVVSDSGGSHKVVPSVAVREEFQHQTYRRSIEPGHLALQNPNLPPGPNIEHDAYCFYQNILARPNLGPSSTLHRMKEDGVIKSDTEKVLPSSTLYREYIRDANTDKTFPAMYKNYFSKEMPTHIFSNNINNNNKAVSSNIPMTAHLPDVFNVVSSSPSSLSPSQSPLYPSQSPLYPSQSPLTGSNPFTFQTVDNRIQSSVPQASEISQSNKTPGRQSVILDDMQLQQQSMVINQTLTEGQASGATTMMKSVQPSCLSPQKKYVAERSCMEIPRYIEVNNPLTSQREMMSLSHHIETTCTGAGQRNSQVEHGHTAAERCAPRLAKSDSVDTMHKRPIHETDDRIAKRSKEDPDCIQTIRVDSTITKLLPDQTLAVPVIGEPQRRPSLPSVVIETDNQQDVYQKGVLQGVMDDPEIDLTDGPIDVKVEHCTRQFYLANFKQSYSMRRIPRGKALILNVNEVTGKPPRRGTDIDRENLHNLLCQLHFDVTVFDDKDGLTAKEMVLKLQDFSQDARHRTGESAIVCILSHGEEGYIFGSDGKKFELEGAFSLFDNTSCPLLRGKPKIFIVQACRGGALDRGVQYYTDEHDGSDARLRQCPSMSDMLICYPTQNGYYAWRNRDRGSWYVEALVQVFMKYAKCEDVCTMLNRVNLLVSKKVSNCPQIEMDQMSQMSEYKSTLRMPHLFFFPGIGTLI